MMKQAIDVQAANGACEAPAQGLRLGSDEAASLAAAFKAIGHPVRLQLLALLAAGGGELCVCELEACFALAQPTISHHLRVLREAGLVRAEQRGLWAHYEVRRERIEPLRALLDSWNNGAPPYRNDVPMHEFARGEEDGD